MKRIKIIYTLIFLFLCAQGKAQNQEDYINSSQEKYSFDEDRWGESRKDMLREARGQKSDSEVKDYTLRSNDVATESEEEGDFYKYKEEGYNGEYADYGSENDFDYDPSQSNGGENNESYDGNSDYYEPKEHDVDYGKYKNHPSESENYKYKNRDSSESGGLGFFKYILFFLLIALLIFIIYQFFMKTSLDDKGTKMVTPLEELEPSHIPKTELEILLEKALSEGNYREAVRIYFIFIIKDLSEKDWIRWEKKKTNMSYLMEMRNRPQYPLFNEAVSVFEFVWYGNYPISKEDFNKLEPKFKNLLNSLN